MPETSIGDVRTIGVEVADQDAALTFYVDVLGFEKRLDATTPTLRWVEVAPPGARTSIALTPARPGTGAAEAGTRAGGITDTGVRFTATAAAAEHTALRDRGVDVGELLQWPGTPPMFSFDDPDGNRFYVVQDRP